MELNVSNIICKKPKNKLELDITDDGALKFRLDMRKL